ncbi:hypothetical protein QQS21_001937 [Conoideocrella luteorostrata]|uniref:Endonuclease/exonuclease/phosphatase domain-containing protein n=1 Tax=Conoideocrella luteorostrata TaxID=1105319 RepID=A0AAJ0CVX5_9HYPO|nr:hypothetical protein QQS21_001937 [Conoideocrella luteorostrata]
MLSVVKAAVLGLLAQASLGTSAVIPRAEDQAYPGKLAVLSTVPLKIQYETSKPATRNWIGLYYAAGGGPEKNTFDKPSIRWTYAPDAQGSVEFDNNGLGSGQFKVYFLADDQYTQLAAPVELGLGQTGKYPGTISVDYSRTPLNIKYTTSQPNEQNWIGLYYADKGGPVNEVKDQDSLTWDWAKSSVGEVTLSTANLNPGEYKAFLLADNGYKWLSEPIVVTVHNNAPFDFIVKSITTKNARVGDKFEADIGNLVTQPSSNDNTFSITSDKNWAAISSSGLISGTPPPGTKESTLNVEAKNKNGGTASISVKIPVQIAGSSLVQNLRVLSFNLWYGGTKVNNYHEKQARFLVNQNVDIVGFQESGADHGTRLAHTLGWYSWQGSDVSIISRYPIIEVLPATSVSGAVRISLDGAKNEVIFWNAHLGYDPYGPYDFCFEKMSQQQVFEREAQSGRTPQIQEITKKMQDHISNGDNVPVFLVGDFNAPSHLDWTSATRGQHCNVGDVQWPSSKLPTDAGLIDSFRVAHPDPVAVPGITWSPIYLTNNGRPEPLDRIDFVYHKSKKLVVQDSQALVVRNPTPEPNQQDNEWPSDHRSVLTTYKLNV